MLSPRLTKESVSGALGWGGGTTSVEVRMDLDLRLNGFLAKPSGKPISRNSPTAKPERPKEQCANRNLEALARQLYDYWFVQFDFPDESGNTLKIKCSGTPDKRANIFSVPTTSEAECISQCLVSDKMPYSY